MSLALEDCSDGELAALALSGRQSAYTALLGRYREPVFRVVRATIGDDDDAVDVTQEAFVSAFAALKTYDSERPFKTWISRIAINKCRDWARRRAVRRAPASGSTRSTGNPPPASADTSATPSGRYRRTPAKVVQCS